MKKTLKLGPLGMAHQYMSNTLGPFILVHVTDAVEGIDDEEYPLRGGAYMIPHALVN